MSKLSGFLPTFTGTDLVDGVYAVTQRIAGGAATSVQLYRILRGTVQTGEELLVDGSLRGLKVWVTSADGRKYQKRLGEYGTFVQTSDRTGLLSPEVTAQVLRQVRGRSHKQ